MPDEKNEGETGRKRGAAAVFVLHGNFAFIKRQTNKSCPVERETNKLSDKKKKKKKEEEKRRKEKKKDKNGGRKKERTERG